MMYHNDDEKLSYSSMSTSFSDSAIHQEELPDQVPIQFSNKAHILCVNLIN